MAKHVFWGIVVLVVAIIGGYVSLVVSGHPAEAQLLLNDSGSAALIGVLVVFFIWIFS